MQKEAEFANLSSVCGCGAADTAVRQRPELMQHPEDARLACRRNSPTNMVRVTLGGKRWHCGIDELAERAGAHRCRLAR